MKSCNSFRDLEQFGIMPLTGEADALGYRILCDLTPQGVKVFQECYGMPNLTMKCFVPGLVGESADKPVGLADNWNSGGVASVMLTGYDLVPLSIMGFYLKGYNVVLTHSKGKDDTVFALEHDEDLVYDIDKDEWMFESAGTSHPWPKPIYGGIQRIIRQRKSDGDVVQGTRNVHQMTGRVS